MELSTLINRFGDVIVKELIKLVNSILHALNIPYDIADLYSKYNILNNTVGHHTSQITAINRKIRDLEVPEIYIGCGNVFSDVIIEANKHENFLLGTFINLSPNNEKIFVCYNSDIEDIIELNLNGIMVPVNKSTETYNEVEYTVLESNNSYDTTFDIEIK